MSELKPCPFCGGIGVDPEGWASVDTCGPECVVCGATATSIDQWNTRHIPEGYALVPVGQLEEHLKLLQESDWSEVYKLAVGNQIKAMIEAAQDEDTEMEEDE